MITPLTFRKLLSCLPLVGLTLLSSGCGSFGKDKQTDFLKQFGPVGPQNAEAYSQPMPSEYTLCVETAKTVANQGHAVEAIKLYERAEFLKPTAPALDSNLAPLYASTGNHSAAIERYQRCAEQSPQDVELCNNFAWTLMEAGQFTEAVAEATRGLQLDGDNARLQGTLAMIHYRQGDHLKALRGFEKAHGPVAAHHNLSLLEIDSGNLESAKAHLKIANQATESNPKAKVLLTALETQTSTR